MNLSENTPLSSPIVTNGLALNLPMGYTGDRYTLESDVSDMVLYLPMGRTRNANDVSGQGNNGTLVGDATVNSTGVVLDGTGDYVSVSHHSSLNLGSGNFAVSLWYKHATGSISLDAEILIQKRDNSNYKQFNLQINDTEKLQIDLHDGSNVIQQVSSSTYNNTNWHFVVLVRSGTYAYLYVDNVLQATGNNASLGSIDNTTDVMIGHEGGSNEFNGIIDDVIIYNKALTASEITTLYNNGKWRIDGNRVIDISNTKQNCSLISDAIITSDGVELDGTDDYVSCGNLGTNIRTVALWVNLATTSEPIFESTSGVDVSAASGTLSYTAWDNAYVDGVDTDTITTGWHYVVVTSTTDVDCSAFNLGKDNTSYMEGYIDNVTVWSRELSANEIAKLAQTTPKDVEIVDNLVRVSDYDEYLTAYWSFDESSGDFADSVGSNDLTTNAVGRNSANAINGKCAACNGSISYIEAGASSDLSPTTSMALAFWMQDINNDDAYVDYLFYKHDDCYDIMVSNPSSSTNVYVIFGLYQSDITRVAVNNSSSYGTKSTWIHYVFVADNGVIRMYQNGDLVDSDTYDNTINVNNYFGLKVVNAGPGCFHGFLDESAFWKDIEFANTTDMDAFAQALYNDGDGNFYNGSVWSAE